MPENRQSKLALRLSWEVVAQATLLVSLLQPPPETFELFDDVMLLSDGVLVYSGPRDQVTCLPHSPQ